MPIRVIVLGGAGDVGSRCVEECALDETVGHVTIADKNHEAAVRVEEGIKRRNPTMKATLSIADVDAFNHQSMVSAIKGHDVCASALGPFHMFEVRCARASIDAQVTYCSVCDDWNAAADIIDQLDETAKNANVLCVTGFGATPGASNVSARYLANRMDKATDVEISCFQPLNAGGGEAVLRHMLFVMSGSLPVWREGRKEVIRACSTSHRREFPKFGTKTLWPMGHAEPVTMYRFMPDLRNVDYRMGFGFGSRFLVWPAYFGFFKFAFMVTLTVWFFGWVDWVMRKFPKGKGALRIDVYGVKDGQTCHEMICGTGEMREVTGVSLATGALLLGNRRGVFLPDGFTTGGVYAPEGCMDPPVFMQELLKRGFTAYHDVGMTQPLTSDEIV